MDTTEPNTDFSCSARETEKFAFKYVSGTEL